MITEELLITSVMQVGFVEVNMNVRMHHGPTKISVLFNTETRVNRHMITNKGHSMVHDCMLC